MIYLHEARLPIFREPRRQSGYVVVLPGASSLTLRKSYLLDFGRKGYGYQISWSRSGEQLQESTLAALLVLHKSSQESGILVVACPPLCRKLVRPAAFGTQHSSHHPQVNTVGMELCIESMAMWILFCTSLSHLKRALCYSTLFFVVKVLKGLCSRRRISLRFWSLSDSHCSCAQFSQYLLTVVRGAWYWHIGWDIEML